MRKAPALALVLGLCACSDKGAGQKSRLDAAPTPALDSNGRFDQLASQELEAELATSPTLATWLGVHGQDERIDDLRPDAQSREAFRWKAVLERLRTLDEAALDGERRFDRLLLMHRAEAALQEINELKPLERNPLFYFDLAQSAIFELVSDPPPSLPERLRTVTARLWKLRPLFDQARRNLRAGTPAGVAELAARRVLELGPSLRSFLAETLPRALQVSDGKLMDDLRAAIGDATRALDDFLAWVQKDLVPRARGELAWGRDRLMERLRLTEGLEATPELLLAVGERELKDGRLRLEAAAREVLLGKPGDLSKAIEDDHGKPDDLPRDAALALDGAIAFLQRTRLMPLTSLPRPLVAPMPAPMWGFMQLNMAGPLERARDALLWVEPIAKSWPERRRQEHLRAFNRPTMLLTVAHDLSHWVAAERNRRAPTTVQKLALAGSLVSGWPNYAERMLLDAGYGDAKVRVVAERAALVRAARLVAAVRLHAFGARLDEVAKLFVDSADLDDFPARREAERAALDPMVMLDALGRIEIERLRDDWGAAHADATLGSFHEALLAHGSPPVALLRKRLLPGDSKSPL